MAASRGGAMAGGRVVDDTGGFGLRRGYLPMQEGEVVTLACSAVTRALSCAGKASPELEADGDGFGRGRGARSGAGKIGKIVHGDAHGDDEDRGEDQGLGGGLTVTGS